jgi:hypothetical protein
MHHDTALLHRLAERTAIWHLATEITTAATRSRRIGAGYGPAT